MIALNVRDRVAYSVRWLRSVGAITGDLPFKRGCIVGLDDLGGGCVLATVAWDGETDFATVNVNNLTREDRIAIDSALNT